MRIVRIIAAVALATGGLLVGTAATPASAGTPTVTVTPSTGLVGGQSVVVRAHGLPSGVHATITQCDDSFIPNVDYGCERSGTMTTNGSGRASSGVALKDPVIGGNPIDVNYILCRADHCRIFVTWLDSAGDAVFAASGLLEFRGSPATMVMDPAEPGQRIHLHGTAYGAEGRTMVVVEEVCGYKMGYFCSGNAFSRGSTVIRSNGTWSMNVHFRRFFPSGLDCSNLSDSADEACQLTARVLDSSGTPDASFGAWMIGRPGIVPA